LLVFILTAGDHQEWGFVGDKIVNVDVVRRLQSALTFQRPPRAQDLRGVSCLGGRTTLVVQKIHTARLALANPIVGHTERISTRSEMEQGAPLAKSKGE
jgi:hypothetical protein